MYAVLIIHFSVFSNPHKRFMGFLIKIFISPQSKWIRLKKKKSVNGAREHLITVGVPLCKSVWRGIKKLKTDHLWPNSAIPGHSHIGFHTLLPRYLLILVQCSSLHNFRKWKHPSCSSSNEWMIKMGYIETIEIYSAMKDNKMKSISKWMELEINVWNNPEPPSPAPNSLMFTPTRRC